MSEQVVALPKKLTFKQRKFFDIYYETGNASEAAMRAYDCKDRFVAKSIGNKLLTKVDFNDILEGVGLTDVALSKKIQEKLQAKDPKFINNKWVMADNHQVQLKATELGLKLRGRLKDSIDVSGELNANIQIQVQRFNEGGFVSRRIEVDATSEGSVGESKEIQSPDLAQESKENNNSNS